MGGEQSGQGSYFQDSPLVGLVIHPEVFVLARISVVGVGEQGGGGRGSGGVSLLLQISAGLIGRRGKRPILVQEPKIVSENHFVKA